MSAISSHTALPLPNFIKLFLSKSNHKEIKNFWKMKFITSNSSFLTNQEIRLLRITWRSFLLYFSWIILAEKNPHADTATHYNHMLPKKLMNLFWSSVNRRYITTRSIRFTFTCDRLYQFYERKPYELGGSGESRSCDQLERVSQKVL